MIWTLAVLLFVAYFLGPHWFQAAGIFALLALFCSVAVIGLGMRGMEKNEL